LRLRDELWRVVERASPLLSVIDDRYSLVHADYKRSNLLMQSSASGWKVGAVLDCFLDDARDRPRVFAGTKSVVKEAIQMLT
jgi:Ser/Thr protein kinase RdoA (MazF antagonist)